jgi:hypothetical protein
MKEATTTLTRADTSERISASFSACSISVEHAGGLRMLMREALPSPAICLMRLQCEALTRSIWLLYAAPDSDINKLQATLTLAAEKAANKLPMLSDMLKAIEGKAPPEVTQKLNQFKDVSAGALNSFVHGGIHPLKRHSEGYPLPLLIQIIRNSNGLLGMSGQMLAILAGNANLQKRIVGLYHAFNDCFPEPLPSAAS